MPPRLPRPSGLRCARASASGGLLRFPGALNPLSARVIEQQGFDGVYVSGAVIAADLGLPDIGLTTLSEVAMRARQIARLTELPALVDADTGFGEPINVARTVQELEDAGVAGLHIEDQVNPKRCGHLDGKEVVDAATAAKRIAAAVDARRDPNLMIIARTDIRGVAGRDAAVERSRALVDAGADAVFPEAMTSLAEFEQIRNAVDVPMVANMTEFGKSPLFTIDQLRDVGVDMVIWPVSLLRLAMGAVVRGLEELRPPVGSVQAGRDADRADLTGCSATRATSASTPTSSRSARWNPMPVGRRRHDIASTGAGQQRTVPCRARPVLFRHHGRQCSGRRRPSRADVPVVLQPLDRPPLVALAVSRTSASFRLVRTNGVLSVNVLADHQRDAEPVARAQWLDSWCGIEWHAGNHGQPILPGSLATLECRIDAAYEAGDHHLVVAEVLDLRFDEQAQPLLYFHANTARSHSHPQGGEGCRFSDGRLNLVIWIFSSMPPTPVEQEVRCPPGPAAGPILARHAGEPDRRRDCGVRPAGLRGLVGQRARAQCRRDRPGAGPPLR